MAQTPECVSNLVKTVQCHFVYCCQRLYKAQSIVEPTHKNTKNKKNGYAVTKQNNNQSFL